MTDNREGAEELAVSFMHMHLCTKCGELGFDEGGHADCDSLETRVHSSLLAAADNGYSGDLLQLTDMEVAEDMVEKDHRFEDEAVEAVAPHVRTWKLRLAEATFGRKAETPEKEEKILELLKEAAVIGSGERVRSGPGNTSKSAVKELLRVIAGSGTVTEGMEHYQKLKDSTEGLERVLNKDAVDALKPSERVWQAIHGANVPMLVHVDRDQKEDQHVYVLMQDEGSKFKWHFWVLCPNSELSLDMKLVGPQERVVHRASIVVDMATDKIRASDVFETATGREMPETARREADAIQKRHRTRH